MLKWKAEEHIYIYYIKNAREFLIWRTGDRIDHTFPRSASTPWATYHAIGGVTEGMRDPDTRDKSKLRASRRAPFRDV